MSSRTQNLLAALVGVVAAMATLGIAEVVALFVAAGSSPLAAVGSLVIDIVPSWVKDTAIALFGTGDKAALIVGLGILVLLLALAIGVLQFRRPPLGLVALGVVGLVATIAATTRAESTAFWAVPTVIGMIVGIVVLHFGTRRLHQWVDAAANADARPGLVGLSRRGFIGFGGATAAAALIVGVAARMVNSATTAVTAVREGLTLPAPVTTAAPVPAGAELDVEGISQLFTPNLEFYRIDTALQVPLIDPRDWVLRVTGMVEEEVELTLAELLDLPLIQTDVTLACVSNEVGGGLIGNARWTGYPIRDLLARAQPLADADMVLSRSVDGFTASTPLSILQEEDRDAILAVSMNGDALPLEHGFPVRMVVPGLYGYVSATKWVTELKLTRFADETAYWTTRGWDAKGPIKTSSRIDVPTGNATIAAGHVAIAGVAWSQHTGIEKVEVRVDNGAWTEATLAEAISLDTWVQWVYDWEAEPGSYVLQVRATDLSGKTQSGTEVFVAPNGSEGWHTIDVRVD